MTAPTSSTATDAIEAKALRDLRTRFRGALLQPGEEGYEEARRIWSGASIGIRR